MARHRLFRQTFEGLLRAVHWQDTGPQRRNSLAYQFMIEHRTHGRVIDSHESDKVCEHCDRLAGALAEQKQDPAE